MFDPQLVEDQNYLPTTIAAFEKEKQKGNSPKKIPQSATLGDEINREELWMINNDGNHIRRPKMTLSLLDVHAASEIKGPAQMRRKNIVSNTNKLSLQPAELNAY